MEYELADFDLKRLIGQQLTSVWVATNTISLYFLKYSTVLEIHFDPLDVYFL